jgi:hypothetical protein
MTVNDENHRENGVRKLGDPAGASDYREARDVSPDSNADLMHREPQEDSRNDSAIEGNGRERVDQTLDPQIDATNHDAVREASRLGAADNYLVDQDMEDLDERQDQDGPDGRPSPLANADNPER